MAHLQDLRQLVLDGVTQLADSSRHAGDGTVLHLLILILCHEASHDTFVQGLYNVLQQQKVFELRCVYFTCMGRVLYQQCYC